MATIINNNLPPLPPGFVLTGEVQQQPPPQQKLPPLPPGFVLSPQQQPAPVQEPQQPAFGTPEAAQQAREEAVEELTATGRGILQGVTLGFADELVGALGAIGARIVRPDLFQDETAAQTTARGIDIQRAQEQAAREKAPKSFIGGEVAGALGTSLAGLGTKVGQKVAEFVARAPSTFGLRGAVARGGVVSAPVGGIQAFGGAEGDILGRSQAAALGFGVAAVTGGALTGIGKEIAKRRAPKIDLSTEDIPLTLGERTQDAAQQSFEESALKGGKGALAQSTLTQFKALQQKAVQRKISDIKTLPGTEFQLLDDVVSVVSKERQALDDAVGNAFTAAKEGGKATISGTDIKGILLNSIDDIQKNFNLSTLPKGQALFDELTKLSNKKSELSLTTLGRTILPTDIVRLENWRRKVTRVAFNSNDREEKAFATAIRVQYDTFLKEILDQSLVQGDDATIKLYQTARGLRARFGKEFENDKLLAKIVTDETLTPENVSNIIFGAGAVKGKQSTVNLIDSIYKAAGDNKPVVQEQLKSAALDRIFTRSLSQQITATGEPIISFAKLNTELKGLLTRNASLAKKIFTQEEITGLQKMSGTLNFIVSKKPGVVNASNSFEKLAQNIGMFRKIPGINVLTESIRDANNASQAADAISGLLSLLRQPVKQTKFVLSVGASVPIPVFQE